MKPASVDERRNEEGCVRPAENTRGLECSRACRQHGPLRPLQIPYKAVTQLRQTQKTSGNRKKNRKVQKSKANEAENKKKKIHCMRMRKKTSSTRVRARHSLNLQIKKKRAICYLTEKGKTNSVLSRHLNAETGSG